MRPRVNPRPWQRDSLRVDAPSADRTVLPTGLLTAFERALDSTAALPGAPPSWRFRALRLDDEVVGLVAEVPGSEGDAEVEATFFLAPKHREKALGDEVVERLGAEDRVLLAPEGSGLADYLLARAWAPATRRAGWLRLTPPARRTDLRPAASVALVDTSARRILLGRRLTGPWPGFFAFPGGGIEPGESPAEAARRELREETEIGVPPELAPRLTSRVFVGRRDGSRAYVITNFAFAGQGWPVGRTTDEIEPHWLDFEAAWRTRPMAAGTRRVLRKVLTVLG